MAESTAQSQLEKRSMVTSDQVTVVIPTLNEREGIGKVLDDLKSEGFDNVLVVDGYSDDGTVEIAKSRGAVVLEQHGPGKAGALVTAASLVTTPFMVVMDGDDTYKAADVHRLVANAADHDEVIGARTIGRDNISLRNRFGNWVISKAFKLLFTKPITDVLSGMYLLRTETMREIQITSTSFDVRGGDSEPRGLHGRHHPSAHNLRGEAGQAEASGFRRDEDPEHPRVDGLVLQSCRAPRGPGRARCDPCRGSPPVDDLRAAVLRCVAQRLRFVRRDALPTGYTSYRCLAGLAPH